MLTEKQGTFCELDQPLTGQMYADIPIHRFQFILKHVFGLWDKSRAGTKAYIGESKQSPEKTQLADRRGSRTFFRLQVAADWTTVTMLPRLELRPGCGRHGAVNLHGHTSTQSPHNDVVTECMHNFTYMKVRQFTCKCLPCSASRWRHII